MRELCTREQLLGDAVRLSLQANALTQLRLHSFRTDPTAMPTALGAIIEKSLARIDRSLANQKTDAAKRLYGTA